MKHYKGETMKRILSYMLFFLIFLFIACTSSQKEGIGGAAIVCIPPQILVADECCDDKNNNSVCDQYDAKETPEEEEQITTTIEEEEKSQEIIQKEPEKQVKLTLKELEDGISKQFSSSKRTYLFRSQERENLTDFESLYEVRESTPFRFFIWKIKKEYNYLNYDTNFSSFARRSYDLTVKNNNIYAKEIIDYNALDNPDWVNADYYYNHTFDEESVLGTKVIAESHITLFYNYDNAMDAYIDPVISIWCSPDMIVKVYPSKLAEFGWASNRVDDTIRALTREMQLYIKEILADSEKIITVCEGG